VIRDLQSGGCVRVSLAYGDDGLDIEVPADATVVYPKHQAAVADAALRSAPRCARR
jgi:hypothetical protein